MNEQFLELLLSQSSVAGDETDATDVFGAYLQNECTIQRDVMGNCYAILNPESDKRLMIEAHIDEIGFQVTWIDENGFVYVRKNGGIDCACVPGSQVIIKTRNGEQLPAVIGKSPIHVLKEDERKKVPELDDLWVDTGLSVETVKEKVTIGDTVAYIGNFIKLGEHRISSKGLDDKIGVYIIAEVMKILSEKNLDIGVYGVASVQEEVGCKGAVVGGYKINPHIAFCLDVGITSDVPNISKKKHGDSSLGKGIIITSHTDSNRQLSLLAEDVARRNEISHQLSANYSASGGTDTKPIQLSRDGVRTLLMSIPCRYLHTQVEMCDLRDVQAAIDLLVSLVCHIDTQKELF